MSAVPSSQTWWTTPRGRRVGLAALFGALAGVVLALSASLLDAVFVRDLPLRIDGLTLAQGLLVAGGGLAALGALTAWPQEGWHGLLLGSLSAAVVLVVVNLLQARTALSAGIVVTLLTAAPLAVVCAPAAWLLRWLAGRWHHAADEPAAAERRRARALLIALTVVLGLAAGWTQRMPARALTALRTLEARLQAADGVVLPLKPPAQPALQAHLGQAYGLSQQASRYSSEGYDVRVTFADGYAVTCVVIVYPGAQPTVSVCSEGDLPPPAAP